MFNKTLINDGYTEHISEKLIDNSKIFYHNAEKINSGFLNSSNNVMSVREKFDAVDVEVGAEEIVALKDKINELTNKNLRLRKALNSSRMEKTVSVKEN